jgi:hypothetical protein
MIATFDGDKHSLRYKAAGRPDDYQLLIEAPDAVWSDRIDGVQVYANVFGGSERSVVECRVGGDWRVMAWTLENDPRYAEMARAQDLPFPLPSNHLWKAALPELAPGTHVIEVRARDVFGQRQVGRRMLRVQDAKLRPEIEAIEPAVLMPGGEVTVRCSRLAGADVRLIVPVGPRYEPRALAVRRDGNVLRAKLPPELNAGKLRVRSDLMLSDEWLYELGSASPNGVRAEYFRVEAPRRGLPDLGPLTPEIIRRDAGVDFADRSQFALPFAFNFAARWSGRIDVETAGEYAFALNTDDGSRLWINGDLVVDNADASSRRQRVGKITLGKGKHEFRVEYVQRGGDAIAQLKWRPPGADKGVPVPTKALLPPK